MLMADTMAVFFVVVGLALALVSLSLLVRGLWPNSVEASAERVGRGLVIPFLVGAPVATIPIIIAIALAKFAGPAGTVAGALILSATVFHSFIGIAGLSTSIGRRLSSTSDSEPQWRTTMRGSIVLVLSGLLPVVGWFVLLPSAFFVGSGAATIALIRRAVAAASRPATDSTGAVFGQASAGAARQ